MSLSVYLSVTEVRAHKMPEGRIYLREGGYIRQATRAEWDARHPGVEPMFFPATAEEETCVFEANVTHNLVQMADAAGLWKPIWRPEECGAKTAGDLIRPIFEGLVKLKARPEDFMRLNPSNGWGDYGTFVEWVERYLEACRQWPHATIRAHR